MSSPDVLDFAALLAPIPGDSPAGVDLRRDGSPTSPYYAIRDARKAARAAEKAIEEGDTDGRPDWRPVLQTARRALGETSKDLELAAYTIEALLRLHGFAGLRDGFRLARELVERYWEEGLYPHADEDGVGARVWALVGLTGGEEKEGTLLAPIQAVPLSEPGKGRPFSFNDYRAAVKFENAGDAEPRQGRLASGGMTLEDLQKLVADSSSAFYHTLVEDLTACQQQFSQLNGELALRCGEHAPAASEIRGAFESCLDMVPALARDKLAEPAAPPEEGAPSPITASPDGVGGAVRTREDALRNLLKVAEFFRRTEPHTVLSFALEQVVRWGRMPLPDLLTELIPEESARFTLFKQVGIKPPSSTSES